MSSPAPFANEGMSSRGPGSYANPHATIAQRDIPTSLRQVLRLCRWYYQTDSILGAIIEKMSEYPITALVIKEKTGVTLSDKARDKWDTLLNVSLNIRERMRAINVDKFVYGNSFHLLHLPFVRTGTCLNCGASLPLRAMPDIKVRVQDDKKSGFTMTVNAHCNVCDGPREFKVHDRASRASKDLKFVQLNPLHFELEYGVTSGRRDWYWTPPDVVRDGMAAGVRVYVETTDMRILRAAHLGQKVEMFDERLWVAQSPGMPGLFEGWGIPPLFKCLEDVYYYKILRRANEALAQEHVTPFRIITPANAGEASAQRTMNLSEWQSKLRIELQRFKTDPNHLLISPVPLNIEQMGGNARVMMVAAEIEAAARVVSTGLGCPIEFIWGGLNWTGATVSLRVLENHFLNERESAQRLLDFLIPRLAKHYQLPLVEVKLADFKMADDVQRMSNDINLMLQGFLSRETVLSSCGIDHNAEFRKLEAEHKELNRITMKDQVDAAHMQTLVQALEAKAQILLQFDLKIEQQRAEARAERIRVEDLNVFTQQMHDKGIVSPLEFEQSSTMLARMDPQLQQMILSQWAQTMPTVTQLLVLKMQADQGASSQAQAAISAAPGASSFGAASGAGMPSPTGPYGADSGGGAPGQSPDTVDPGQPMPEQRQPRRQGGT